MEALVVVWMRVPWCPNINRISEYAAPRDAPTIFLCDWKTKVSSCWEACGGLFFWIPDSVTVESLGGSWRAVGGEMVSARLLLKLHVRTKVCCL